MSVPKEEATNISFILLRQSLIFTLHSVFTSAKVCEALSFSVRYAPCEIQNCRIRGKHCGEGHHRSPRRGRACAAVGPCFRAPGAEACLPASGLLLRHLPSYLGCVIVVLCLGFLVRNMEIIMVFISSRCYED